MSRLFFPDLMLALAVWPVLSLSAESSRSDGQILLYFQEAVRETYPLVLHVDVREGRIAGAVATSPYFDPAGGPRPTATGSLASYARTDAAIGKWESGPDSMSFDLQAAFPMTGKATAKGAAAVQEFRFTVSARLEMGRITGRWTGAQGAAGSVIGTWEARSGLTEGVPVTLVIEGWRANWAGRQDYVLTFVPRNGQPQEGVMGGSPTGSVYNTEKFPRPVLWAAGADGGMTPFIASEELTLESLHGTVGTDQMDLTLKVGGKSPVGLKVEVRSVGRFLHGRALTGEGKELGVVGQTARAGRSFGPGVPSGDPAGRILAGLQWAYSSPEMGGLWSSDALAASAVGTGDKQYDNFFENVYGGVAPMVVLARSPVDPAWAHEAKLRALRAGWALHTRGAYKERLAAYYKGMFWLSAWGPLACLDLYRLDGGRMWLERARNYADTLKRLQMDAGTWTYFDEESGEVGKSNERNNRSHDNHPLHCAEFLWFLGRLRVEAGVEDYHDVENRARLWMAEAFAKDPVGLFTDRRPGDRLESGGATLYALYLLMYGGKEGAAEAREVAAFVEKHLMDHVYRGAANVEGFSPAVVDYLPRHGLNDTPGPSTATTARLAVVYQLLHKNGGTSADLSRARALHASVMSRQVPSGMIHHLGLKTLPDDHAIRLSRKMGGGPDQHPYSVMKAEALVWLHAYEHES
jgi:hypothetical protein